MSDEVEEHEPQQRPREVSHPQHGTFSKYLASILGCFSYLVESAWGCVRTEHVHDVLLRVHLGDNAEELASSLFVFALVGFPPALNQHRFHWMDFSFIICSRA